MTTDRRTIAGLTAALLAAGFLLFTGPESRAAPTPPPGRRDAATAWPKAVHADLPGLRATPLDFLDARTAVGTLPTGDGAYLRLVIESATGPVQELARLPADADPQFTAVTGVGGGNLVWAQTADHQNWQIWAWAGGTTRRLVADAGDVLLGGGQFDLVVNAGRVYWATAAEGASSTGIHSAPLAGNGPADVRGVPGQWALDGWPWLTDDVAGGAGTIRLRSVETGREVPVQVRGGQVSGCTAQWCRVMMLTGHGDLARVDLMHPDGTARRSIAGPGARSAVDDVAVLGRFEILSEPDPYSDLTGTAALVVYDLATGGTVVVSPAAGEVATHDGLLWWSTGQNALIWHTLDLRTA